jgi:hypothetical protein
MKKNVSNFKAVILRAALVAGVALFFIPKSSFSYPMTGYVGVLGASTYQGMNEGSELTGGARIEFNRLVKYTALDLRYASGKHNYMGGSLRFFKHWETERGNHWTLGAGPGATYAPQGNFYGNETQVGKAYIEYFIEGFASYIWDFQNGVGLIVQWGVQAPFQRKYQNASASPNNEGYLKFRPFLSLGMAFDVD